MPSCARSLVVLRAFHQAMAECQADPGMIHHSDQGVQYASADYVRELEKHGFRISMSRKGNPFDNARLKSFGKTLKQEEVYLSDYCTLAEAQVCLGHFIEEVYNRKRLDFLVIGVQSKSSCGGYRWERMHYQLWQGGTQRILTDNPIAKGR
jgi:transposase InsO family protein